MHVELVTTETVTVIVPVLQTSVLLVRLRVVHMDFTIPMTAQMPVVNQMIEIVIVIVPVHHQFVVQYKTKLKKLMSCMVIMTLKTVLMTAMNLIVETVGGSVKEPPALIYLLIPVLW
jgi:hypothetical protein